MTQPYDMELGAGTLHPAPTLRSLGSKPWAAAYVQPSRRPTDGRYGENPNRLQHYYQYQVLIKPSPPDLQALYLGSLEAIGIDEEAISKGMVAAEPNPIDTLQEEDFKNNLATSIAALPERERMIVNLYYDAELNLREIGSVLGVSESRTSQLLSQALIRLRARMNNWVA